MGLIERLPSKLRRVDARALQGCVRRQAGSGDVRHPGVELVGYVPGRLLVSRGCLHEQYVRCGTGTAARPVGEDRRHDSRGVRRVHSSQVCRHFWLGCSKYQASKAHTFAPLWDYPEDVRARIAGSSIFSSFNVALPLTTRQRLAALYDELALPAAERLDLIVLTKDESLAAFAPSPKESSLVFENDVFRVWTRIPGNGRPGPDGNGPAWRTLDGPNAGPLARPRASSR